MQALWPLSWRHRRLALKPRQPKPRRRAEVVQLQDAPAGEYFDPLLGEGSMSVGEVVHGAGRAVRERKGDSHRIVGLGCRVRAGQRQLPARNWRAGKVAQQIDEMAGLADDAPATDRGGARPVTRRLRARIDRRDAATWGPACPQQLAHPRGQRCEAAVETHHEQRPAGSGRGGQRRLDRIDPRLRDGQRLLNEHVFAGGERAAVPARRDCHGGWRSPRC